MKVAIVSASELGDRWDAPFHVARTEPRRLADAERDRVAELRATVSPEEAVRRLDMLSIADRTALVPLLRGERKPSTEALRKAAREYPHLALALVERHAAGIREAVVDRIREGQATLAVLGSIAEPSDPGVRTGPGDLLPGHAYPFKDPSRFDDGDGQGYGYALLPDDDVGGTGRMRMAWVVDVDGVTHPNYASATVPVAIDDVDPAMGFPLAGPVPGTSGPGMR